MRVPGHLKSLLDHFGVHWFSHRPEPKIFDKKALVITQGIGASCGGALKDVRNCLEWYGISDILTLGIRLVEGVIWDELSDKMRSEITTKINNIAQKAFRPTRRKALLKYVLLPLL